MAYVPGCQYDIFVSYAHVDDLLIAGAQKGWVTTLVDCLRTRLAQKLGREEAFSLWMDPSLQCHGEISPQIIETLGNSATILVILSPGYLESIWCRREAETFFQSMKGKYRSGHRLFVVERDRIGDSAALSFLKEVKGFRFWEMEQEGRAARIYGDPVPSPGDKYYSVLMDLADELANELKRLKSPEEAPQPETSAGGPMVYLADVTDDLDPQRDEIRRYLEQAGIKVLPQGCYSREPSVFQRLLEDDLGRCTLFVQLLSALAGKKPANLPQGYVALQYEVALTSGKKIMQWRSPELDLASVPDQDHLRLLHLPTVSAVGLEQFKGEIRKAVEQVPPPPRRGKSATAFVFVNTEKNDRQLADTLCEAIVRGGSGYVLPRQEGTPEEMRKDLEENLSICDAIIIIYASTTVGWVREQLLQCHKIVASRETPLKALAVFEGPPKKTCALDLRLPNMEIIDSSDRFDEDKLLQFLESLHKE